MINLRFIPAAIAMVLAVPAFASDITVVDAYARSASPEAKVGAAFMQIMNAGPADRLISVRSPAADLVQIHTHEESATGVMQMRHVEDGLALPERGILAMKRGGDHVMLMGLTAPLVQGAALPVTLIFERAGEVTVDVSVDLERMPGEGMPHGDMAE